MSAYVLLGGSGYWNLIVDGSTVAGGHIPATAPRTVIGNQARRFSSVTKRLGGGSMLDLKEAGLTEEDARAIASHAANSEHARLQEVAKAFEGTRKYIEAGWVAVGQSPYPRKGMFFEKEGKQEFASYD